MPHKTSIREEVAEILTTLFGDKNKGVIFLPEKTTKRTGGGKKITKYELKTTIGWSARYDGNDPIFVSCVGMTMAEFLKEFKNKNIYCQVSEQYGFHNYTIYLKKPEFKTYGCVRNVDLDHGEITLYLWGLIHVDEVTTQITDNTPKWLTASPTLYAAFHCKIYQGWRSLKSFDQPSWDGVWKTFKFDSYLKKQEAIEYF